MARHIPSCTPLRDLMSTTGPEPGTPAAEVLVVIHVDSGWEELERDLVLETRPDDHLYLLVPTEGGDEASSDGRDLAGEAGARARLDALLADIRRDGRSAAGEVGDAF